MGCVVWHFSIINPLFNQVVKISQFTEREHVLCRKWTEGDWPLESWPDDRVMADVPTFWAQAIQWVDLIYHVTNKVRWIVTIQCIIYDVPLGFPRVTSSLRLTRENRDQFKPVIRGEHLFPRHLITRRNSNSCNLQSRDNYTCLLWVTQREWGLIKAWLPKNTELLWDKCSTNAILDYYSELHSVNVKTDLQLMRPDHIWTARIPPGDSKPVWKIPDH